MVTPNLGQRDPVVQAEIDRTTAVSPSAVARFGRLTIIVLGQVIVGVVRGVAGQHDLSSLVGAMAALGMLIAIWLWWIYVDLISRHLPRPGRITVSGRMYLHLPMTMGIAAVGAAILNVVEGAGEHLPTEVRWLLVGATGRRAAQHRPAGEDHPGLRAGSACPPLGRQALCLSSAVMVLLGFTSLDTIPLLLLLSLLLLAPVFFGFKTSLQMQVPEASRPA